MKLSIRIWVLIVFLMFSLISIFVTPTFMQKGVLITSVEVNSTAHELGLTRGQVILEIDGQRISNIEDYSEIISQKFPSVEPVKTTISTKDLEVILFSDSPPEITFSNVPKTNLKLGLDLAGGSRALVRAEEEQLTQAEVLDLVDVTSNRLDAFGIEDVKVIPISDLDGNNYMLVEIAGVTPKDLQNILSQQGKFEAKIGEKTVFVGGEEGVASVVRSGVGTGIYSCTREGEVHFCNFRFGLFLTPKAAQNFAEITKELSVNISKPEYLNETIDLYLDGTLVESLLISKDLKGRAETQISISGSGSGRSEQDAYKSAQENMNYLQTILITGSLPYKLEIVKLDTISPTLGREFILFIFLAGIAALIAILVVVSVRYKKIKSSLLLLVTSISELIIILGIASFIDWNIDLPSIAGILASIGTGIDSQIIILDESHEGTGALPLKRRLKRAFAIILGTYFTTLAALFPLWWAGAGLLKGFAVTTIIGISIGVIITRPAFIDMIKLTKS